MAARIQSIAEQLVDAADIAAGSAVLDVATGSGNAALAAARSGGDVEDLPFADASFDSVISVLGVMFTADQERAASELLRVARPGGTIALANWTPSSFIGEMFRAVARHVPPPAGVRSPLQWGTEPRLAELLGDGVSELLVRPRTYVFRFRTPDEFVDFFRANYGPVHMAFAKLDEPGQARFRDDLAALAAAHDGSMSTSLAIPSEYLEVVATRRH